MALKGNALAKHKTFIAEKENNYISEVEVRDWDFRSKAFISYLINLVN